MRSIDKERILVKFDCNINIISSNLRRASSPKFQKNRRPQIIFVSCSPIEGLNVVEAMAKLDPCFKSITFTILFSF
jgi:hypothetical protein